MPPLHRCPECDELMAGLNIRAHARSHWPDVIEHPQIHAQAVARQAQLLTWADEQDDELRHRKGA